MLRSRGCLGEVWLDGGGFSRRDDGQGLAGYLSWIDGLDIEYDRVLALEDVGNAAQTYRDWREMRDQGYSPIPVFGSSMHPAMAREYYRYSDLVAVGGKRGQGYLRWFRRLWRVWPADQRQSVHLLGVGQTRLLRSWRPYGADSSGWVGCWLAIRSAARLPTWFVSILSRCQVRAGADGLPCSLPGVDRGRSRGLVGSWYVEGEGGSLPFGSGVFGFPPVDGSGSTAARGTGVLVTRCGLARDAC